MSTVFETTVTIKFSPSSTSVAVIPSSGSNNELGFIEILSAPIMVGTFVTFIVLVTSVVLLSLSVTE